eukprot:gene13865-19790_t
MLKNLEEKFRKAGHRVDGTITNAINGLTIATKDGVAKIDPEKYDFGYMGAPEVIGASYSYDHDDPSTAVNLHPYAGRPAGMPSVPDSETEMPHAPTGPSVAGFAANLPLAPNEGVSPTKLGENFWSGSADRAMLALTVREARNVAIVDFDACSSHVFVKIQIGRGASMIETTTRICYRNRFPLWMETFFFSVYTMPPSTPLKITLLNSSIVIGQITPIGSIRTTLHHLLQPCSQYFMPVTQWYRLNDGGGSAWSSGARIGDLQLVLTIIPLSVSTLFTPYLKDLTAPPVLRQRYDNHCLKLVFTGLQNLRLKMTPIQWQESVNSLNIEIKVGHKHLVEPVIVRDPVFDLDGDSHMVSFPLDLEVTIPLDPCFDLDTKIKMSKAKKKKFEQEIGDVKIFLRVGTTTMCKTQVPIWTIPPPKTESTLVRQDSATFEPADAVIIDDRSLTGLTAPENSFAYEGSKVERKSTNMVSNTKLAQGMEKLQHSSSTGVKNSAASASTFRKTLVPRGPSVMMSMHKIVRTGVLSLVVIGAWRTMESYSDKVVNCPILQFYGSIIPFKSNEANITLDDGDDDPDTDFQNEGEAINPINLPPPLQNPCAEANLSIKPLALFEMFFEKESAWRKRTMSKEGLTDVDHTNWAAGEAGSKTRTVTYTRPLTIPLPMAPKQCGVTEIHTVNVKETGGFVVEEKVSTSAPKGDSFCVHIQIAATWDPQLSKTFLRISCKVEILKSLGFLKSAIENELLAEPRVAWAYERMLLTRTILLGLLVIAVFYLGSAMWGVAGVLKKMAEVMVQSNAILQALQSKGAVSQDGSAACSMGAEPGLVE